MLRFFLSRLLPPLSLVVLVISIPWIHGSVSGGRSATPPPISVSLTADQRAALSGAHMQADAALVEAGVRVATGRFGAKMLVEIRNDGPVTITLDSRET